MQSANPLEFSPFLNQLVTRFPGWLELLRESGRLDEKSPPQPTSLEHNISDCGLERGLRQFRNHEMLRIIWRDLGELASLKETLADLSTLAETCLQAACDHHTATLTKQHGVPRSTDGAAQGMVVIGLGKLGGWELNLSSDIDIVFCYPHSGACDGRRGLSNEQFFTRLARKIIRSLSEVTVDGFCFRVDTRLRPFGESGPLVSNFAALEQYYQREGRDWERYALIKARPVAGDLDQGRRLLSWLKPFVYRRYIDFGAIEAMHEMHANVRTDALRNDRADDIKRGPGGIREIEFLVQSFQLLRGGREASLQTSSLFKAVKVLQELGLLTQDTATDLLRCYGFLRKLENRIQALHDQQTHLVPDGRDGLLVAGAMGFDNMAEFKSSLDDIRASVKRLFEHSLPPLPASTGDKDPWHVRWQIARYGDRKGFDDPPGPSPLTDFIKRMTRLSLSQRASKRLDEFMPQLLEKVDGRKLDDAEFSRVLDLISAICRRSAYLSLLVQNPGATDRMLELFVASEQIAGVVTRYPALLDELIDPSLGAHLPTDDDLDAGVQRILNAHADTETTLQNLNYFKKAVDLRVAVAIFKSSMRVFEAQSLLSHLAECLIQAVLTLSTQEVADRHGPLNGPGLAVIAYGSLGSRALRFDSDLDLIFLYQRTEEHSTGPRSVPAEGFHTRVARRLLNLLSAITPSGRLYNIDARLRPNGRSGLLVSSVEAFARYQLEQAWVWELQALTRARPVAGSAKIGRLFGEARHNSLTAVRDLDLIRREVPAMRVRLRKEHHEGDALKHAPGGLLDIEFLVQYGVLLNAHRFTSLIDSTVTIRQMRSLGDTGWLGHRACSALEKAYTLLNQVRLTTLLSDIDSGVDPDTLLDIARPFCAEYW